MKLKLLTPARRVVDQSVTKIVAEGTHGSFCLLPQHVDFLAALVPGLLSWEDEAGVEHFAAVGDGVLVKQDNEVLVSSAQATAGTNLEQLKTTVREEFATLDDRQRAAHAATAKLEASFLRRYMDFAEQTP
ncbi:F0F1 ATP synthase subunit epsilon [Novipirellula artificiosorum]|uniref:F0F1 ATP synthase subunit epsilon n=1 Tax=Novipirellula artificiosorum TaxID=2528016 RepID=A0A5C6DQ97_9BACT|nr:F0F1 ATP synthase subunit epsilon [Novipirellula artificiosorum]TWU38344.1 F0F1 ATP synthase subunit epsilon [Novipirellula artificiosorum]